MLKRMILVFCVTNLFAPWMLPANADPDTGPRSVPIANGWAKNSINGVIFRRNSVVTHRDTQYVAFYDEHSSVVLAKRKLGSEKWEVRKTRYKGNTKDAHNSISIMVDSSGFLHVSWDHHVTPLRYCRGISPGSLELTDKMPMTGKKEQCVTYPEFYRLPDSGPLFLYRDGASGRGDLIMNIYDVKTSVWTRLHDSLISGEGQRNAYWQAAVDSRGTIHLSWVWRESGDVATNHDICYARSKDRGKTWEKTTGDKYTLPITEATAEYARRIPQRSELINQTSMCADSEGRPYIATYWRPEGTKVPQYHIVYHDNVHWRTSQVSRRLTPFYLSGGGTKRIPISRPQIAADGSSGRDRACMLFRDVERGSRVSAAMCDDLQKGGWRFADLTEHPVGLWEPSYDTELWARSKVLHIFVQKVGQGDGDKLEELLPQPISIVEWKPEWKTDDEARQ